MPNKRGTQRTQSAHCTHSIEYSISCFSRPHAPRTYTSYEPYAKSNLNKKCKLELQSRRPFNIPAQYQPLIQGKKKKKYPTQQRRTAPGNSTLLLKTKSCVVHKTFVRAIYKPLTSSLFLYRLLLPLSVSTTPAF